MRDVLIAWYFIAWSAYTLNVITPITQGPFADQAQCNHYRGEIQARTDGRLTSTSCWWDGK